MQSIDTQQDDLDIIAQQWQQKNIINHSTPLLAIGRLLRLEKALSSRLLSLQEQYDLKQGEFDVLAALYRADSQFSLTPSQLHQSMLISSGAMTSRLQRLENKKLIKRRHCNRDRRIVHVSLTKPGQALMEQILPEHFNLLSQLTTVFSDDEQQQLALLLRKWLDSMTQSA